MIDFCNTFSRVVIIIGMLVALQYTLHNSADAIHADIMQALRELDPYKDLD